MPDNFPDSYYTTICAKVVRARQGKHKPIPDPLATNVEIIKASVESELVRALRRARNHLSVNEIVSILQGMNR